MRTISFNGFVAGLIAGAALAVATPGAAMPAAQAGLTAGASGIAHGNVQLAREHRPRRAHVRRHVRRHIVRHHRFRIGHIRHLTKVQLGHWRHGRWWHGRRHGRVGWWWLAGGIWYWYPAAVYPYPSEISATAVYDYAPEGKSDESWYYCEDPEGYYPYVKTCNGEWKAVPIQPQANAGDDDVYGMPPGGDDEGASEDEGLGDEDADSEDAGDDEPQ
jgi:hypothetical protein